MRHYRRGGLVQHLLGDRYWGRERFLQEVLVTEWARDQGIPTVEILALRIESRGWGFFGADLLTREIQGAQDLDMVLKSWRTSGECLEAEAREKAVRFSPCAQSRSPLTVRRVQRGFPVVYWSVR